MSGSDVKIQIGARSPVASERALIPRRSGGRVDGVAATS